MLDPYHYQNQDEDSQGTKVTATDSISPWPLPRPGGGFLSSSTSPRISLSFRSRPRIVSSGTAAAAASSSRHRRLSLLLPPLPLSRRFRRALKMAVLFALFLFLSLALSARIRPFFTDFNGTEFFREEVLPAASGSLSPTSSPSPSPSGSAAASPYPYTHGTDFKIHDPNIILVGNKYYSYSVGPGILIHESYSLDGPWIQTGRLLDGDSVIPKGDRVAPWAPNTVQIGDIFYCYYSVSNAGCRDSAIGVATSDSPGPGGWTDHGMIIQSGTGEGSEIAPLNTSNAIDPNVFVDFDGTPYLVFGSFWSGLWEVELNEDLISVAGFPTEVQDVDGGGDGDKGENQAVSSQPTSLEASHLGAEPGKVWRSRKNSKNAKKTKNGSTVCGDPTGGHPIEGGYLAYHAPYYYMWFSWGRCCEFKDPAMRNTGKEYRIRVGRSDNAKGPFLDKAGIDLVDGGGETVYGTNGDVFAPGGQGILTDGISDILYYHYLNSSVSYEFSEARLGYNRLTYVDGWPVAVY
ncbi:arabinan endo-1,5-alpha-L-arabinosidase [Aspergillus undulatus]|uniref:arabinan endo-1,5-alpha-L-arabinosidase n=1 Tax=Aspergillus undulatus TaxID=1810928 RepID=UPI003CCDC0C8